MRERNPMGKGARESVTLQTYKILTRVLFRCRLSAGDDTGTSFCYVLGVVIIFRLNLLQNIHNILHDIFKLV